MLVLLAITSIGMLSGHVEAQEPVPAPPPTQEPTTPPVTTTPAPTSASDGWQFEVTPYFWGAGMDGTVGVGFVSGNVDMGVGDILDRLDSAFMGMVEARKGRSALLLDGGFMQLKGEQTRTWQGPGGIGTATGDLSAKVREDIYNLAYGRRVVDEPGGSKADLILGARYTRVESTLTLTGSTGGTLPGSTSSIGDDQSWWDPVIGLRLLFPVAKRWTIVGYADMGGFGVGSDITTQALAGINWEMTEHFIAKAGYRYLMDDYSDDGFVWQMATHGFYAGVGIRF
jgi:hypothetical protein